ncbi:arsenic resistance N-acetyltransferase ArsN2 [uncultured Pseudacidovorax sp.]|uniref:arsenic resistance N-acetyltransferase ArsN2 n=1 Tax=uncultured Pseudacidovorax sp. TaxID=679313 RepID=UPI0025E634CE|nr:arsenic resistance N-acetyltransferase ArsN2 [uncultured Pseudacidovorax sp.]
MEPIAPLVASDHSAVCALLRDAGLPSTDVQAPAMPDFLGVRTHGGLVAAIGLERYDGAGLLRSLVVAPGQRGLGLASRLVDALERRAKADGLPRLVLLTESARSFFEHRGYAVVAREQVPAEVLRSEQFRELCPASAACLSKIL